MILICLAVLIQYRSVTNTHSDTRRRHILRYSIASRGKMHRDANTTKNKCLHCDAIGIYLFTLCLLQLEFHGTDTDFRDVPTCNFVNVYTIVYRVQYTCTSARIPNGLPREDPREEKRACRTSRRGSSCVSVSWRGSSRGSQRGCRCRCWCHCRSHGIPAFLSSLSFIYILVCTLYLA